jgi:hypothetical protein
MYGQAGLPSAQPWPVGVLVPHRLVESLAARGRTASLLLAAVLAGAAGGAWAVAGTPGLDRVSVRTVADEEPSGASAQVTGRPTDAGRPSHAGKPAKTGKPDQPGNGDTAKRDAAETADGAQGGHGRCVSEVARSDATGGDHDNHGGAVSAAAHDCPRPGPESTDESTDD